MIKKTENWRFDHENHELERLNRFWSGSTYYKTTPFSSSSSSFLPFSHLSHSFSLNLTPLSLSLSHSLLISLSLSHCRSRSPSHCHRSWSHRHLDLFHCHALKSSAISIFPLCLRRSHNSSTPSSIFLTGSPTNLAKGHDTPSSFLSHSHSQILFKCWSTSCFSFSLDFLYDLVY